MERQPIPGNQPGMADHAPKQDRWRRGRARCGAPVFREFARFSRVFPGFSVLDAQDAMGDALILRFRTPSVTL